MDLHRVDCYILANTSLNVWHHTYLTLSLLNYTHNFIGYLLAEYITSYLVKKVLNVINIALACIVGKTWRLMYIYLNSAWVWVDKIYNKPYNFYSLSNKKLEPAGSTFRSGNFSGGKTQKAKLHCPWFIMKIIFLG